MNSVRIAGLSLLTTASVGVIEHGGVSQELSPRPLCVICGTMDLDRPFQKAAGILL